jgi:hypothetical protein
VAQQGAGEIQRLGPRHLGGRHDGLVDVVEREQDVAGGGVRDQEGISGIALEVLGALEGFGRALLEYSKMVGLAHDRNPLKTALSSEGHSQSSNSSIL